MGDLTSSVSIVIYLVIPWITAEVNHGADKLEAAVMDLEKRRVTKEEGLKAQRAMEALEVGKTGNTAKPVDVDFIVRQWSPSAAPSSYGPYVSCEYRFSSWNVREIKRPTRSKRRKGIWSRR